MTGKSPLRRPGRSTKPRSRGRTRIDADTAERICALIRSWPSGPMTWELLVETLATRGDGAWTRQGLHKHAVIAAEFAKRKKELRNGDRVVVDPERAVANQRIAELTSKVFELERKLAHYEERHVTMMRNAAVRGMTMEELERPLPPVDRAK